MAEAGYNKSLKASDIKNPLTEIIIKQGANNNFGNSRIVENGTEKRNYNHHHKRGPHSQQ